ncbi:hypothetical protein BZA77DRAFT_305855 [Pyronema omphalodes]|nr:hypothetical protein BZA77DRAFT_305855 [Pyronema omphalodes]
MSCLLFFFCFFHKYLLLSFSLDIKTSAFTPQLPVTSLHKKTWVYSIQHTASSTRKKHKTKTPLHKKSPDKKRNASQWNKE